MIGFLRFLGLINAAVWLGAAAFFVLGAEPATSSPALRELIGHNNFPYFSVAISQIIATRFFFLYLACAVVAVIHMAAEWLYLGKYPANFWLGLVAGLCLLGLSQAWLVYPSMMEAHKAQFRGKPAPDQREQAARSFRAWHAVSSGLDWLMLAGLGVYFWRVATPNDSMRFVSARQFRS